MIFLGYQIVFYRLGETVEFYQFNGKSSGENGRSGAKFTGCYLVIRKRFDGLRIFTAKRSG
jgi:hypothetical protein